jgi:hypothetical protein
MSYSQASGSPSEVSQYTSTFIDLDIQSEDFRSSRSSQITAQSTPFSVPPPPPRYQRAPDSLQRVGKPFQLSYVLYNSDETDPTMQTSRTQFVEWWLLTEFGSKKELQKSITEILYRKGLMLGAHLIKLRMRGLASQRSCVTAVRRWLFTQSSNVLVHLQ